MEIAKIGISKWFSRSRRLFNLVSSTPTDFSDYKVLSMDVRNLAVPSAALRGVSFHFFFLNGCVISCRRDQTVSSVVLAVYVCGPSSFCRATPLVRLALFCCP